MIEIPKTTTGGSQTPSNRILGFPANDKERQEATDPFYPQRTNPFFDIEKAVQFYRDACGKHLLQVNHSFVNYLRSGSVIMEFDNGYFGENGIIPIMSTLKNFRILKLLLPKCMLEDNDIKLICDTFSNHSTLETLDLRGNKISASGAKNILRLLIKNKRITEVLLDAETPKFANIVNQASENGSAELRSCACLCCDHPVVYSLTDEVEIRLLKNILNNFQLTIERISKVQVEVLFRLVLFCCEVRNGVLSLCSEKCLDKLSRQLHECLGFVTRACDFNLPYDLSDNHPLFRQCLPEIIVELNSRPLSDRDYHGEDSDSSDNIENYFDVALEGQEGLHEECSVCGQKGKCCRNGYVMLMKQLVKELDRDVEISSSSLLRLCHVMISNVSIQPCSRKCVRQLIRFGLTGFYGVIRAFPQTHQVHLLSRSGISTQFLSASSFSVVNFNDVVVDRLDEEEITCALTVASAMEDIDNVPIDPYLIFAIGRHVRHQAPRTIGMELQGACEAVHLVGCLPQSEAPFKRRAGDRPPRRFYANWEDWYRLGDVKHYLHCAFARRRVSVFAVDGPHGNMFDNIRAALWALRHQKRSAVAAMKFSPSWLVEKSGVISETSSAAGGFYTTVKIIGQTTINNSLFLILQGNFGPNAGQKGFFYVPKSVFNRHYVHNAYIFVDLPGNMDRLTPSQLYAAKLIQPSSLAVVSGAERHGDILSLLEVATRFYPFHKEEMKDVTQLLIKHLPKITNGAKKTDLLALWQEKWQKYFQLLVKYSPLISQIAHFFNEICPSDARNFLYEVFASDKSPCLPAELHSRVLKLNGNERKGSEIASTDWHLVKPEHIVGASTVNLKMFLKKNKKKKSSGRGRLSSGKDLQVNSSNQRTRTQAEEYLEEVWRSEKERLDRLSQKVAIPHYAIESIVPYACCPKVSHLLVSRAKDRRYSGTTHVERDYSDDSLEASLIGYRWNLIHLMADERGKLSHLVAAVIHQKGCLYDLSTQKVVVPLGDLSSMEIFSKFPFCSGFDTCFHHPLDQRYVYFFSSNCWIEWDALKHRCMRGPFELKSHPWFEKMPSQFHQGIQAAIPILGSPYVVFCTQKSYILFNIEKKISEYGPQLMVGVKQTKHRGCSLPPSPSSLARMYEVIADLWTTCQGEVMTCFFPIEPHKSGTVVIVFASGELIEASFSPNSSNLKMSLPTSPLQQLPLVFLQVTTEAIPYLCELVEKEYLKASGKLRLKALNRFDLNFYQKRLLEKVKINCSNFKRTSTADHFPYSLHSVISMKKRSLLLSDEVHFLGSTPVSEDRKDSVLPTFIEYDFGSSQSISFSAVVLFLDVSQVNPRVLELSPPTIAVESSMDQVTYRTHCIFRPSRFLSHAVWPESHMSRFWRLRFLNSIPCEVGIVRVFWYKAKYSAVYSPMPVLESYVPLPQTARITVAAEVVMRQAEDLWWGSPLGGPVFAVNSEKGWYEKHAVLPILPMGDTCLFFCGNAFAEMDMGSNEIVGDRSMSLSTHPCFSTLPAPFSEGFDAIFYPNENDPTKVLILRDGYELKWNLSSGSAASSVERSTTRSFEGINIDMTRVYDVLNVWGRPGEVDLVFMSDDDYHAGVIRWNVQKRSIVNLPTPIRELPDLYHPQFHGKRLLCLFSTPRDRQSVFVFAESLVANTRLIPSPVEAAGSSFFRLAWALPNWMKKQHECIIHVDFMAHLPLILGVVFVASSPGNPQSPWKIEYSDDSMGWKSVGVHHYQDNPYSTTTWLPRQVENQSHRFWRFSLPLEHHEANQFVRGGKYGVCTHLAVKSISFLALPVFPFNQPSIAPMNVSSSSSHGVEELLKGDRSIRFSVTHPSFTVDQNIYSKDSLILPVHHITFDYRTAPVHLSSFSCDARNQTSSDQWYVYCSDEGKIWHRAATGSGNAGHIQITWITGRSYRFWRFEFQADGGREFYNFTLYGYKGPSIGLSRKYSVLPDVSCPSLLPLLYRTNSDEVMDEKHDCLRFDVYPDATIVLDAKADRASIVGVKLVCSFASVERVVFMVEYSDDIVWWYEKTRFFFIGDSMESSVFWNSIGSHRFWRLRVLTCSSSDGYLLINKVLFSVSPTQLYHTYLSPVIGRANSSENTPDEVYFISPKPISFVRVQAELPPNSLYAVEKLGLDGVSWEVVKQIENLDMYNLQEEDEGWEPVVPSTSWRIRFLNFLNAELEGTEPVFPQIQTSVKWFAFTSRRLARVPCEDLSDLEITLQRFTPLNTLNVLHANPDFPVLQIDDSVSSTCSFAGKDISEEREKSDSTRRNRKKEDDGSKLVKNSKTEDRKDEQRKSYDKASNKLGEAAQNEKEQNEINASLKTKGKPVDPSILYSFKFPTCLHQACVYALIPQEGKGLPLRSQNVVKVLTPTSKVPNKSTEQSRSGEGSGVSEDGGEDVDERDLDSSLPVTVVVEISDNGADFVVLARSSLGQDSTTLRWNREESSQYWRIRFENTGDEHQLLVYTIKWFSLQGVASKFAPLDPFILSNSIYSGHLMETFSCEEEFRRSCRAGLDQVRSCASKLREEFDIDTTGEIAGCVLKMKKTYQHFWAKISKTAVRNAQPPEGPFFGASSTLAKDLNYYLFRTSQKFTDSGFYTLTQMVQSPLVFKEWRVNKKESPWFYPCFEITGILLNDVYHFPAVPTSFIVLWTLSAAVQRNIGLLNESDVSCVGINLASPLIVMSIESDTWTPEGHFPFVPFLSHGGYANGRMTIIVSLNTVCFTERHTIRSPAKGVPLSSQRFRISPGVNFFRSGSVGSCPSPIFRVLNRIYEDSFLQAYTTALVLSVSSLRSRDGKITFILPARKINFGIEGLEINSLEFEVNMHMLNDKLPRTSEGDEVAMSPELAYGECDYQVVFVSHGATFQIQTPYGVDRIPVAISGSFDGHGSPVIQLQGTSSACNIPLSDMKGAYMGALNFSCVVSSGEEPQSFSIPRILVTGNLVLSSRYVVLCHYFMSQNAFLNAVEKLYLDLWEVSFDDLLAVSQWLKSASTELPVGGRERGFFIQKENSTTHILPCFIYASLELSLPVYKLFGTGEIKISGEDTGTAEISVDGRGFRIVSRLKAFHCGAITLKSPLLSRESSPGGVLLEISAFFAEGVRPDVSVETFGLSDFFLPHSQTKLHISRLGCICVCSTPYFLLTAEENFTELVCSNAAVSVASPALMNKIIYYLKNSPMIIALLANGLPFCFSNEKLTVTPFNLSDRRLNLTLSGVLLGNFFEVMSGCFNPSEEGVCYDELCEILALRAIEACQEMIWASYGSVVGCLQDSSGKDRTELKGKDFNEIAKRTTFTSRWNLCKK